MRIVRDVDAAVRMGPVSRRYASVQNAAAVRLFVGLAEFCQAWNFHAIAALNDTIPETAGPAPKTIVRINKEIIMKRLMLVGAAALVLVSLMPDDASAQRGRGGGGGMRVGGGGGGVHAAAIGGGYRGAGIAGGGYAIRSAGIAPGVGIARGGYGIRSAAIAGGGVWRGRRGWGIPVVAGLAAAGAYGYYGDASYGYSSYGYSSYGYSSYDQCLAWNGYGWVSVCRPADWNYGNNSMW